MLDRGLLTVDPELMVGQHGTAGGEWAPVPSVDYDAEGQPGPVLFIIDVDGEEFSVRQVADAGWAYGWLSGPNHGYGFATSGPSVSSLEEHRLAIRSFLSMVDPGTGYIEDG